MPAMERWTTQYLHPCAGNCICKLFDFKEHLGHRFALPLSWMDGSYQERWQDLCKLVAEEKNSDRVGELVRQLLEELNKKDERLKRAQGTTAR